jgi:hypothetical protein
MNKRQVSKAAILGISFWGLIICGAASVGAGTMYNQQALLLAHIPLGGGQFLTTNYVFTATENAATINVKCFSAKAQRIGPTAGVDITFNSSGQVIQQTPTTLSVTSDVLFVGLGWCYASTPSSGADFNVQVTVGVTADLTAGGILNSSSSSFIGTSTGLGEFSTGNAGVPFWTTAGGALHFVVLVDPTVNLDEITLNLSLSDASGGPKSLLTRNLSARGLVAVAIPGSFALASPPTSGSLSITAAGSALRGYLGWYFQVYPNGRAVFNPIGIDNDDRALLTPGLAP